MKTKSLLSLLALSLLAAACSPHKVAKVCPPSKVARVYESDDQAVSVPIAPVRRSRHVVRMAYGAAPVEPPADAESGYASSYYDYQSSSSVTADAAPAEEHDGRGSYSGHFYKRRVYDSDGYGHGRVYGEDFNGGVGHGAMAGGGAAWVDGYGRAYASGGSSYDDSSYYNGPDYNGNPRYRGPGNMRFDGYSGYNFRNGLSNGY